MAQHHPYQEDSRYVLPFPGNFNKHLYICFRLRVNQFCTNSQHFSEQPAEISEFGKLPNLPFRQSHLV